MAAPKNTLAKDEGSPEGDLAEKLKYLRRPFEPNQISHLPKGTKAQNECAPNEKVNCNVCGGWHHPRIVHLSYVGHAGVTNRLLEIDPEWSWQPMSLDDNGMPKRDEMGGMWIKLTVLGITRIGYGDAGGKTGNAAIKELIGDAIRNCAMRYGVALDLWSKSDLDAEEPESTVTLDQSKALFQHCKFAGVAPEIACAVYNIRSLSELPESKYAECFERITKRGEMRRKAMQKKSNLKPAIL